MVAFQCVTTLLTEGADTGQEDLSVVLPHGSRSTERDTVDHGDAHIQEDVEREPPSKKQKSTDEGT